jgi:Raf kinase inhibitor-like YbhB/YbcL family protein
MYRRIVASLAVIGLMIATHADTASAQDAFVLTSPDVKEGEALGMKQVFNAMGCTGENLSPKLDWANAPAGTQSFAVTVYDPDAPTGSGWWQWQIYDIPATATGLPEGVGSTGDVPEGAQQGRNDGGAHAFGGACPPPGTGVHRYVFTVFALKVDKLPVPPEPSAAMIGAMLNMNTLAKATITATYGE